jgi:hypothetical protein
MVDFLAALDAAGARPYAKLVFLERLVTTFSEDSVVALANLVRQREHESEVGPIPACRLPCSVRMGCKPLSASKCLQS